MFREIETEQVEETLGIREKDGQHDEATGDLLQEGTMEPGSTTGFHQIATGDLYSITVKVPPFMTQNWNPATTIGSIRIPQARRIQGSQLFSSKGSRMSIRWSRPLLRRESR